ncbi:DNA-binding HxlR family transcriptional regulator [Massilia sp. UYP11]|uniref:winged helix-turn-helix transcriptional regulator n=1 Tax=Massilia sp. UYP11 TaxID=1756385 RepID=UPI003D21F5D2
MSTQLKIIDQLPAPSVASAPAQDRFCSVARTVEILSDAWSFLVLREAFFGTRRFEGFQSVLRLPRNTLVLRLNRLTELGLLQKASYSAGSTRFEYRFADKGLDLFPVMLAMLKFGDTWLRGDNEPPLQLVHTACGKPFSPVVTCSACGEPIDAHDVKYRNGPGAGSSPRPTDRKRSRRPSDPQVLERVRPCSVARTLQIIGDRWTFLVIREMFFGVRRFDEFQANLGIASNILTDRLQRLNDHGIVVKCAYQLRPERFEYRFSDKGRDLYGSMLVMMHWGDRWLADGRPPLLVRHRKCQHDFHAQIACSECHEPIQARQVDYEMRYTLEPAD